MTRRPDRLAGLSPAYFAMVMATGAVSIASHLQGLDALAHVLFWFNAATWLSLWVLNVLRAMRHRARFLADLGDHLRAPGFFTAIAGTAVLSAQCLFFGVDDRLATALAAFALLLWLALTYTVFVALTVKDEKPPLDRGISGAWLLAVVAT